MIACDRVQMGTGTSLVYVIRRSDGSEVTIGRTTSLGSHLKVIRRFEQDLAEVIAVVPGGRNVDHAVRARFAHLRTRRSGTGGAGGGGDEWFRWAPEIEEWATQARAAYTQWVKSVADLTRDPMP